jgi:3-dehydroquinate synthase
VVEIKVDLGPASYPIYVGAGIVAALGEYMSGHKRSRRMLVISDEQVGRLYGARILKILEDSGFAPELVIVAPGEESKSLEVAMTLYTRAIRGGLDRHSPIIALGGGVVGDLAGFIAATYLRGVPFIQIPTTLLAQVDSGVGGKVAVNHNLGKNLIGAFYQPQLVVIDTDMLTTLPERELIAGMAEVIKYGVIADQDFFGFLQENCRQIAAKNAHALTEIISRSCRIKADVVGDDEREAGRRMILNFGHTIAHAIEGSTGFDRYNHGEAVSIGMHGAALLSRRVGLCSDDAVAMVRDLLLRYGLPVTAPGCQTEAMMEFIHRDKKAVGGQVNWILMRSVGDVCVSHEVPEESVRQVLAELT